MALKGTEINLYLCARKLQIFDTLSDDNTSISVGKVFVWVIATSVGNFVFILGNVSVGKLNVFTLGGGGNCHYSMC